MKRAFVIIRVSGADQLRGYGPDVQWFDEVLVNAPALELQVNESLRRIIQESATGWNRQKFEEAVREALRLHAQGEVEALLFPRVDRETRFVFGSFSLLAEVIRAGVEVYFAREHFQLDPNSADSVERYFSKAMRAQAYVQEMTERTSAARRRRAIRDHKMPTGGNKWAFNYDPSTGRYTVYLDRAQWVKQWRDWLLREGASINECCRRMERATALKWYPSTMVEILRDPALIGKFCAYRHRTVKDSNGSRHRVKVPEEEWVRVYEDPTQAILDAEDYYALKEKFLRNRENSPRNTKHWYPPLRGMVVCVPCGRVMIGVTTNMGTTYYRCQLCRRHQNAKRLWSEVKAGLARMLLAPERLVPAVKSQLDSGQSIARLEEELKGKGQRLDALEQAEQKALRLHLYLPNYPPEKLETELHRISVQRQQLEQESAIVQRQLAQLRQAMVDEGGVRRFCEVAAHNLDTLDENQWRVLLETMKLKVLVDNNNVTARVALPLVQSEKDIIVLPSSHRLQGQFRAP